MKKTILILLAMFVAISTYAVDSYDAAKEATAQPTGTGLKKDGIRPFLGVTSNFTMNTNKNVIGQVDGTTFVFGVNLDGSLDYLKGANEIGFTLALNEQFSQTPILKRVVKSGDLLKLNLGYLYHISDVWGPFFSAEMQTSILPGYDERAEKVFYKKDGAKGEAVNRIKLTSGFSPIFLKETLGIFYKPISANLITLEVKTGFGAIEALADKAYILKDDANTADMIEIEKLESYNQLGASLLMKAKGGVNLLIQKITYESYLDILIPFVYDAPGKTSVDLMNIEFSFTASTKLLSFLGIKYQLKMINQPQLLEGWQIQNNIFLDLSYILVGEKK